VGFLSLSIAEQAVESLIVLTTGAKKLVALLEEIQTQAITESKEGGDSRVLLVSRGLEAIALVGDRA
jgi:hypothetical protein